MRAIRIRQEGDMRRMRRVEKDATRRIGRVEIGNAQHQARLLK